MYAARIMMRSEEGSDPSEWLKTLLLGEEAASRKTASGIFTSPYIEDPVGRFSGMLSAFSAGGLQFERDWQHVFVLTGATI